VRASDELRSKVWSWDLRSVKDALNVNVVGEGIYRDSAVYSPYADYRKLSREGDKSFDDEWFLSEVFPRLSYRGGVGYSRLPFAIVSKASSLYDTRVSDRVARFLKLV
jgi:hypothetical protein